MDDWTEEDERDFKRKSNLYYSLSENDKRFIVYQWDKDNGLKSWQERLADKEMKPQKDKQKIILITVGVVVLLIAGFFAGEQYWYNKGAYKAYNDCKNTLDVAMEEYPTGLRQKVLGDFKRVEEAIADLVYESSR